MKKEGSQVVHVDKDSVPSVGVAEEEIIEIGKKNECRSLSERNTLARNFQTRRPRYCSNSSFIFSFVLTLVLSMQESLAFTTRTSLNRQPHKLSTTQSTILNLIPLTDFQKELTFFSSSDDNRCCIDKTGKYTPTTAELQDDGEPFQLYLVEEEDLAEVSLFIVKAFGADAISLSSNEFSAFEKGVMAPALDFFNGYSAVTAFAEVLWGLRIRQADRVPLTNILNKEESQAGVKSNVVNDISPPEMQGLESAKEKIEAANRKSLILVLARQSTTKENTTESKWTSVDSNIDVIASVELRLQPCDAKIPFSLPWWDATERKIAKFIGIPKDKQSAKHLQPYLSTLCVDERYRGQRIGRAMCRCLEDIAANKWKYPKMYLHVDSDNTAALSLYKSEGYKDVGKRWNPFWAGKAAEIGYFFKKLKA